MTMILAVVLWTFPGAMDNSVHDRFDQLAPAWQWLREHRPGWRLAKGELAILTNGSLWEEENTQQNILLRPAPDATEYAVELTVDSDAAMTGAYEHGGLIWYLDDDHWVTLTQLNHVEHGTQKIMLVHEAGGIGMADLSFAEPYKPEKVYLRLEVSGNRFTGFYRTQTNEAWQRLGALIFPAKTGKPRIGIIAGEGDPGKGHWVRFDDFKFLPN